MEIWIRVPVYNMEFRTIGYRSELKEIAWVSRPKDTENRSGSSWFRRSMPTVRHIAVDSNTYRNSFSIVFMLLYLYCLICISTFGNSILRVLCLG